MRFQRVEGEPETIPFDHVTVTVWLRRLTAEDVTCITSRNDMLRNVLGIHLKDNEAFPNAAERRVLDYRVLNYRPAIVESSCFWCTEAKYCWRFIDVWTSYWPLLCP